VFSARLTAVGLTLSMATFGYCFADDAAALQSWQPSFQQVWAADSCAQEFQSWNKYWGNVQAFYAGGKGYTGWFAESQKLLAHVTDTAANATVSAQLTTLGRRIGGEWAKEDGCRKIGTHRSWSDRLTAPGKPALSDLESQLERAASADTGDGASIEAAVKKINGQLDALNIAQVALLDRYADGA
jgi:hypothetical protein